MCPIRLVLCDMFTIWCVSYQQSSGGRGGVFCVVVARGVGGSHPGRPSQVGARG